MTQHGTRVDAETDAQSEASQSDAPGADSEREQAADARAHLDDVDDGCGCAEVWEHLSERREAGSD